MTSLRQRRLPSPASSVAAALLVLLLVLSGGGVARAQDPVGDAANALRSSQLYVGASGVAVDTSAVTAALPDGVKIAILPGSSTPAAALAQQIGQRLDPNGTGTHGLTIGVVLPARRQFGAASSKFCGGYANSQARNAVADNTSQLQQNNDFTALLEDFGRRMQSGPVVGSSCPAAATGSSGATGGGTSGWVIAAVIVAVLLLGGVGLFAFTRHRRRKRLDLARARVLPYYDRLADDLNTLDPGDNPRARQAVADASQRFTSAGSLLADADSVEKYALARRTVLEGLYSTRAAREALGLDPGAELPSLDGSSAGQLSNPQQVTVQGQTFQGYPRYSPSAPYYFGGGWGVPGGWYQTPFWETLLLGSVLTGGFGGWGFGGGGFERGYDAGYESGYDQARDQDDQNQGGGDWGSGGGDWNSGGGDWGSGGGDWNSGGGDWNSGGGDWGSGGGDWGSGGGNDSGGNW